MPPPEKTKGYRSSKFIDNCFFTMGNQVFHQVIGVLIGVDPGPYIANLTLWVPRKVVQKEYLSARMMGKTFRLIDYITSVN